MGAFFASADSEGFMPIWNVGKIAGGVGGTVRTVN
jgi:hypothetical protein